MITDKIKELEATKAKVVSLEKSIASQLDKELSELPAKYGFESAQAYKAGLDGWGSNYKL